MSERPTLLHVRPLLLLLVSVTVAVVLLAALSVTVAVARYETDYQGRVYPGVSALDVDLSGATQDEARGQLAERAAEATRRVLTLASEDQEWRRSASELGLRLDVDPLVEEAMAVGRQGWLVPRAASLWDVRQNGFQVGGAPQSRLDRDLALRLLDSLAGQIDRPVVDAGLSLGPGFEVRVTRSQSGRALDKETSLRRIQQALGTGVDRVELAVKETPPRVGDSLVIAAAEEVQRVISGPLTLSFGQRTWTVSLDDLRKMVHIEQAADGSPRVVLSQGPLEDLARRIADEIQQLPIDARFDWASGRLDVLRPSQPGLSLEPVQAVQAMLKAARSANHVLQLPVSVTKAAVSMEDRDKMGIRELIEQSTTSFAGSVPAKRWNIRLAAERINGTVVPPGGTFSFNQAVGPTTLDAGFRLGFAIQGSGPDHKTVPSVAGGICQVATTLFHTVFWGGYAVDERYPHLYWIPAYTSKGLVGLDTTVDETSGMDFRFTNPTSQYLLVQASVDGSDRLTFALYGTKQDWKVEVEGPVKTNVRPTDPEPKEEPDPTMDYGQRIVVEAARDGFDVRLLRKVTWEGDTRELRLVSRYQPSYNVTLVGTRGAPEPTPTPSEASSAQPTPGPGAASTPQPTPGPKATPTPQPTPKP